MKQLMITASSLPPPKPALPWLPHEQLGILQKGQSVIPEIEEEKGEKRTLPLHLIQSAQKIHPLPHCTLGIMRMVGNLCSAFCECLLTVSML